MIIASRGADQHMVRLPPNVRSRIREIAAGNGRSMNSEVVSMLIATIDMTDTVFTVQEEKQKPRDGEFPSQSAEVFVVRFPAGMRQRFKEIAALNGRSLNAELVARISTMTRTNGTAPLPQASDSRNLEKVIVSFPDERRQPDQPPDKYVARLPDGMRDRLKTAAESNNRSLNAEIVARLARSLSDEAPAQRASTVLSRLDKIIELLSAER